MAFRIDETPDCLVVRDSPRGLWIFGSLFVASGVIVLFNRLTGDARSVRRHPFSRRVQTAEFKTADLRAVEIQSSVDSNGDPMYQLRLWISDSRMLPPQGPAHGRQRAEANAANLRQALGLPDTAATNTL